MQEDLTSFMYGVGPSIGTPGVGAFMRALFPQADPLPELSSYPPIRTARPHPQPPPQPAVTNAPPRRREPSAQVPPRVESSPRPATVSSFPERTPGSRSPISLEDLEDLEELELIESPPQPRVTRAIKPQSDEGSELVRTVLQRAIASSTAQTRPPPARVEAPEPDPGEEDTSRGFVARGRVATSSERPRVFRKPGAGTAAGSARFHAPSSHAGALSAPRVPSIEALIEEALQDPDLDGPGQLATQPRGAPWIPRGSAPVETDEFGEPPTMIGGEDAFAGSSEHTGAGDDEGDGWDDHTTLGSAFDRDRQR
jgi:hypothetical protein